MIKAKAIFRFADLVYILTVWIVMYWYLSPFTSIEVFNEPMEVVHDHVYPWWVQQYKVVYCKHTDDIPVISIFLESRDDTKDDIALPQNGSIIPVSLKWCDESNPDSFITKEYEIPLRIEHGEYRIKAVLKYRPNPLRTVSVEYVTEWFQVWWYGKN